MKALLPLATLLLAVAQADPLAGSRIELALNLNDGSKVHAFPRNPTLKVESRIVDTLELGWETIKRIDMATAAAETTIHLINGDRLTASVVARQLEVESMLGRLAVPVSLIRSVEVELVTGACRNVALGKPVHGAAGASHGKGLAKHVTDGAPATHAKPPASSFDYRIDLQDGTQTSYRIDQIVIHWGHFGDRFKGVRQKGGEGWANAAWPGEYVTSYVVECRKLNWDGWQTVHEHQGRPAAEVGAGVSVDKQPAEQPGYSSISQTRINSLDLHGVTELRIRAQGGHWIGLFELEAFGSPE